MALSSPVAAELLERLMGVQWGISPQQRKKLMTRMTEIVLDKDTSQDTAVRGFLAVLEAQKVDMSAARMVMDGLIAASKQDGVDEEDEDLVSDADLMEGLTGLLGPPVKEEAQDEEAEEELRAGSKKRRSSRKKADMPLNGFGIEITA